VRKIHRRISQQVRFWGSCRSVCIAAGFMTLTSWSHAWSKSGIISTRCSSMKRSGSGVHVSQLTFEHTEGVLNTYFNYVWYLYRHTLRQSYVCAVANSGYFCFGGDLTKPSITIASVDRFYLNLLICLQLDIALSVQNSVKIWHCLSELWQCIQGLLFSWTQCIYTVFHKITTPYLIGANVDRFSIFFIFGLKSDWVMNWSLKIPSHLKHVDTLPCKTLVFKNSSN